MAILSKIKSTFGKIVSNIKNVFSGSTGSSQSASALNYNNPVNSALQKYNKGYTTSPVVGAQYKGTATVPQVYPGSTGTGSNQNVSTSNYAYTTTPTVLSTGSSGQKSNYDSQSYASSDFSNTSTSSSQVMSSPVSLSVNAQNIGTGTTAQISPNSPATQNYASQVTEANIAGGADPTTGMYTNAVSSTTGNSTSGQQKEKTAYEQYKELLDNIKQPNEAQLYKNAVNKSGLYEAQQQKANTQNQINAITAKMNQDLLQLRGTASQEGVTEAVYGGQQAQVTREATIRLLPLQAQLAADQNNIELAQENTDKLYSIYSKDAERSYNYYKDQAATFYQYATNEEKKKIDEIKDQKSFIRDMIKTDANNQSDIAKELLKAGNMSAYRAISALRIPTNVNSPSFQEDYQNYKEDLAQIASRYGVQTETGADAPLYRGLNSTTATAVRQQVGAFKTEPSVQNFVTIQEGRNFAQSIPDKTKNPADDQALIYSLAKALDPGSVVREGEYATAQKYAQSWVKAYGKNVTQAIAGTGFLSEEARKNIKKTIETKYNSSLMTYDRVLSQYEQVINNLTGRDDGSKFLRDYKIADNVSNQQEQIKEWEGVTYKLINGIWTPQ